MEKLGFYSLSLILSYLHEEEGVTFLLSKRKYAYAVLPVFQYSCKNDASLATSLLNNGRSNGNESDYYNYRRKRYQFKVSPVQDPIILLDRLNSRRLYKRRLRSNEFVHVQNTGLSTSELAQHEWQKQSATASSSDTVNFTNPPELELLRFRSIKDLDNVEFQHLVGKMGSVVSSPTLITSYPRSGNSLARTLLERATGYVTGSDTRPDRSLSKELAEQHNLVGEGIVSSQRVLYVKTHYPERIGNKVFSGHSAILLVRNPYDAIDSYWNMNATKSHTKSVTPEVYDQFREMWENLVRNEIQVWNKFLEFWLVDQSLIPVLVVRFEDLLQNPKEQLQRMIEFTIQHNSGVPVLSTYWKNRIHHATALSSTIELGSYQPRSASSGVSSIGKSLRKGHYSDDLLQYIRHTCAMNYSQNFLQRFGYDISEQNFPNNFMHSDRENISYKSQTFCDKAKDVIRVNDGMPIRPIDCPYGRLLQQWRHSVTDNDMNPLPTTEK